MDPRTPTATRPNAMTPVQTASLTVGILFALVGILGFVPGITTDYGALEWLGPDSEAMLLGIFQVSILHNLVHLAFGAVGVVAASRIGTARGFLVGGGALYGVLWIYGLIVDKDSAANFLPLNTADDWLHLALAALMIGSGIAVGRRPARN
jgi:hypothetical protein